MNKQPLLASFVFATVLIPILIAISFALYSYGAHPMVASFTMIVITLGTAKFLLPRFMKRWNTWLA